MNRFHPRRPFRPLRLGATAITAGGLIVFAAAGTASAHVSIAEDEVAAGATALITFQWSHGCDGSPTTEVRIQMPAEIAQVTPTVNANWEVTKTTEALDTPIEGGHGEQITERVAEVVYTAITPLADGFRDTFVLSVPIPDDAAGTTLYFPTIQTCEAGETAWIEIPAEGEDAELESPAPSVEVVEAAADDVEAAEGTAVEGTAVEGTAVEGTAAEGTAVEGTAVEGTEPVATVAPVETTVPETTSA